MVDLADNGVAASGTGAGHDRMTGNGQDIKIHTPGPDAVPIHATDGHYVGYMETHGSNNEHGRFNGRVEIFGLTPEGQGLSPNRPLGRIEINDFSTRMSAVATEGHGEIVVPVAAGLRMSQDEVRSTDAEKNIVYQMARAIAENTGRSTEEEKCWLKNFEPEIHKRTPLGRHTGKETGWEPYGHYF